MKAQTLTNGSRTPLRYPGGKGKVTRFVGHLLEINHVDGTYIEPFAGGAGVAINLLLAGYVRRIIINDLDPGVSAFWRTLTQEKNKLVREIKEVPFDSHTSLDEFTASDREQYWERIHNRYLYDRNRSQADIAFDFFMLNRMNVSGILKGGPIGGHSQNGAYNIGARFSKEALIRRIELIANRSNAITVLNDEGSHFCDKLFDGRIPGAHCDNTFMFVDPPYYKQGQNLYNAYATDRMHKLIAEKLQDKGAEWKWIVTYDDAQYIRNIYDDRLNRFEYDITYSANKRGRFKELLFASPSTNVESYDNVNLVKIC
ncbi:hypothetical phage protein [Parascardovia denticolens DSM 10105 = JCM 12538]|nr:DNA adenine methylase [Parascardovia denticolens]BAR04668.1 hypothetical phage protein [Parascardovia denticolens DSM 10105 = JCM 12538]